MIRERNVGKSGGRQALRGLLSVVAFVFVVGLALSARAADAIAIFDQANRMYEQGKFIEAAAAYQQVISLGHNSATVYYNLGNAWFKAGQFGRAIAAYRRAEDLAPRDPNIRFNLNFARKQVSGANTGISTLWERWVSRFTVNEWTAASAVAFWLLFVLLIFREVRPAFRRSLGAYLATAAALAVALTAMAGLAVYDRTRIHKAVVVVPQAVVRYGPLEDSRVYYQLRDGSEILVLDEKRSGQSESWLQVRDPGHGGRRVGWLKRDQVVLL
jgi:tetratricopeptide (TPR) repeat protein